MNAKQYFIFALGMSCTMGFVMSFIMVYSSVGMVPNFLFVWLKTWSISFSVAFPCAFIVAPIANKLTDKIHAKFKNQTFLKRRMIFAFIMPAMMDFIISTTSTSVNIGLGNGVEYFLYKFCISYLNGMLIAVPLVFLLSPKMMAFAKKF